MNRSFLIGLNVNLDNAHLRAFIPSVAMHCALRRHLEIELYQS